MKNVAMEGYVFLIRNMMCDSSSSLSSVAEKDKAKAKPQEKKKAA